MNLWGNDFFQVDDTGIAIHKIYLKRRKHDKYLYPTPRYSPAILKLYVHQNKIIELKENGNKYLCNIRIGEELSKHKNNLVT